MKIYKLTDDKDANVELRNFYKKASQRARAKIGEQKPPPQPKPKSRVSDAVKRGMSINNDDAMEEEAQVAPLLTDTNPNRIYLSQGLIISGAQLPVIFKSEGLTRVFAELIPLMSSVIVYRCTPAQKVQLVEFIHN